MKKLLVTFIFAMLFGSSASYAQEQSQQDKIYIHPDQIQMGEWTICVNIDGQKYDMNSIHRDTQGIYIVPREGCSIVPREEYSGDEFPIPFCNYGHPSPRKDGFCSQPGCPYNR